MKKWCDMFCEYASFPKEEALTGDCRREVALYCSKYKRLVMKHMRCLDSQQPEDEKEDTKETQKGE